MAVRWWWLRTGLTILPAFLGAASLVQAPPVAFAQQGSAQATNPVGLRGVGGYPLPPLPAIFFTYQYRVRVSVVAQGLYRPWCLLPLPNGEMLVTLRNQGEIRVVRGGVLDPAPVAGLPALRRIFDIALHPDFGKNRWIYFAYSKPGDGFTPIALARGRFDGKALQDVQDLYLTDPVMPGGPFGGGSRMAFAADGTIYVTISGALGRTPNGPDPRKVDTAYGKVIRLRDDGSVPADNPFVGRAGARPEIYTLGHRDQYGIAPHPLTGQMFHVELGPYGGDTVHILKPGADYGWPDNGYGRNNDFSPLGNPTAPGLEPALLVWLPGITPSGLLFYTGEKFPAWKNNLMVGSIQRGRINGASGVERVTFNDKMWETSRETFLSELKQRIRDIRQGPDGLIYLLTEEENGAVLKVEPAN